MRLIARLLFLALAMAAQVRIPGPGGSSVNSGLDGFLYSRTLTIDHTKLGATDVTDFPVLVSFTNASFKTVGNGGKVQNSNGYDIVFFSDSGLSTPLNFEQERFVASTGEIIYWVKLSSISHTVDTVFYMGYDKASISTFQGNVNGTWNSDFIGVWHLPDGTTLTANDSTSTGANGTLQNAPTAATGQMDGAAQFNGSSSYISLGSNDVFRLNLMPLTWSAWVNPTSADVTSTKNIVPVIDLRTNSVSNDYFIFGISGSGAGGTQGRLRLAYHNAAAPFVDNYSSSGLSASTWYHVAYTLSAGNWVWYINGSASGSGSNANQTPDNTSSEPLSFARDPDTTNNGLFAGILDEPHISKVARSADWILTEYNNQNSPGTFITLGTETAH